jgi:hypothetical protein
MKWSITKSKMFSYCQRKWYYSEIMASPTSKDPLRREAYMLKQLQSLHAWRGSIVDKVIERFIIPNVKAKHLPSEDEVNDYCNKLMENQIAFGKARMHLRPNVTKSVGGDTYCAFFDLEYNGGLDEAKLDVAKEEARTALRNLIQGDFLRKIMEKSTRIIAQRQITFKMDKFTVSCTPDLIVFYYDAPPLIVDWKVHYYANADSWLQLAVYAVALSKVKPHKDFPDRAHCIIEDAGRIRMLEYQLFKNEQREYSISSEDQADIYDYIFKSCIDIDGIVGEKKYDAIDVSQFQTARSPQLCDRCQFKRICWRPTPSAQRFLPLEVWS